MDALSFEDFSEVASAKSELISCSVPSASDGPRASFAKMIKVPSLVFDLELEDGGIGSAWHADEGDWQEEEVVAEIQRFVAPQSPAEVRLFSDVKTAMQHTKEGQEFARFAQILTALGYRVQVRTALGGGDGADCLRNLRHTFLTVTLPAGTSGVPPRSYIVDAQFKDQFFIAKTTARYAAILSAVPQVFVGPEEHLSLLVNFLCTEMSAAFKQLGSVLPPWRHAVSMLSKWQPRKSLDEQVAGSVAAMAGAVHLKQQHHIHQHQQAAAVQQLHTALQAQLAHARVQHHKDQGPWQPAMGAAGAFPAHHRGASQRATWEPQRIYFGGNFVPITPAQVS